MFLTTAEFFATKDKIDKLNARSRKRGWTGTVELTGTLTEIGTQTPSGLQSRQQGYEAEITGTPPKYDGWTFLASVEFDPLVTYPAPGAPAVDRDALRAGWCDHCQQNRARKNVYVVRHDDGRQLQVGSTCVKDFLGWNVNPVWISTDLDDFAGDGGWGHFEPTYAVETVLAAAWATIQEFGYVKTSEFSGTPTKYATLAVLAPGNAADHEVSRLVTPHIADAYAHAKVIREFILSDAFAANGNEYRANLRSICETDYVSFKKFGYLVSAPQAWARDQERTLRRQQENAGTLNEWNGTVGEWLELSVTVTSVKFFDSVYGVRVLYSMTGEDKRRYKWWASSTDKLGNKPTGESVKIRGKVKGLDEYEGHKSTVLSYVKVV